MLTGKPLITVLEPDEARGGLTRETIETILTRTLYAPHFKKDSWFQEKTMSWAQKWQLEGEVAEWGYKAVPTSDQIMKALFKVPPIEWNRLSNFQDVTMRLIALPMLPEAVRDKVYVQGEAAHSLPKAVPLKRKFHLYASPHHPRAAALCEELVALGIGIKFTDQIDQVIAHTHTVTVLSLSRSPLLLHCPLLMC